jgi:phage protein D
MTPDWQILADGIDVTANFNDRLIELTVTNHEGMKSDSCEIMVDDRDGILAVPRKGTLLTIFMGYRETGLALMGLFTVDEVELTGFPRQMRISASAADLRDALKSQRSKAYEGKTLGAVVGEIAARHGLGAAVNASLSGFSYDFLGQSEESDLHFLTRLAQQHDALFKVAGGKLLFMQRGEALSASGQKLSAIIITGDCVTQYSATFQDRPAHKKSSATWWNRDEADSETEDSN